MTDEARTFLRDLGIDDERIDALDPSEWYLLLQEHSLFGRPPTLTADDLATTTGVDVSVIRRLWRVLGFGDPGDERVFREDDAALFRLYTDGVDLFGVDPIEHFTRTLGATARRLTDATNALFLETLGPERAASSLRQQLETAWLGAALMARLPDEILRPLVYRYSIESQVFGRHAGAFDAPVLEVSIGFCDLVGSTELLNSLTPAASGRALLEFEAEVSDIVQRNGGRVIKLIGDEVLYIHLDAGSAESIAEQLLEWIARHDVLTGARAGVATGHVLARGGDIYGPTVNLAARLVRLAEPGSYVVADDDGKEIVDVRGFDEPIRVRRVAI